MEAARRHESLRRSPSSVNWAFQGYNLLIGGCGGELYAGAAMGVASKAGLESGSRLSVDVQTGLKHEVLPQDPPNPKEDLAHASAENGERSNLTSASTTSRSLPER
jgi:hypothetical protein